MSNLIYPQEIYYSSSGALKIQRSTTDITKVYMTAAKQIGKSNNNNNYGWKKEQGAIFFELMSEIAKIKFFFKGTEAQLLNFKKIDEKKTLELYHQKNNVKKVIKMNLFVFNKQIKVNINVGEQKNGKWNNVKLNIAFYELGEIINIIETCKMNKFTHQSLQITESKKNDDGYKGKNINYEQSIQKSPEQNTQQMPNDDDFPF